MARVVVSVSALLLAACGASSHTGGDDDDVGADSDADADGDHGGDADADLDDDSEPLPPEPGCQGAPSDAPTVAGFVDFSPERPEWERPAVDHFEFDVRDGVACVNLDLEGFQLLDVANPASPAEIGGDSTQNPSWGGVAFAGLHLLTAGERSRHAEWAEGAFAINVFDLSELAAPTYVGLTDLPFPPAVVLPLDRATALVGMSNTHDSGLQLIDFADPSAPRTIASLASVPTGSLAVVGHYVVGVPERPASLRELRVFEVSRQAGIVEVGALAGPYFDVAVASDQLYASTDDGFAIIDLSDPASPREASVITLDWQERPYLAATGDALVVASGITLEVVDVSNPMSPVLLPSLLLEPRGVVQGVVARGDHAYVLSNELRLTIVDLHCQLP